MSVAVDLEVAVVFVSVAVDLEVAKAAVLLVILTVVVEVVLLGVVDVVLTVLLLCDGILGCTAGCTDLPDARAFFAISDGDTIFFSNCDTATAVFVVADFSLFLFHLYSLNALFKLFYITLEEKFIFTQSCLCLPFFVHIYHFIYNVPCISKGII